VPIGSFVVSAAGPTHLFTMGPSATVLCCPSVVVAAVDVVVLEVDELPQPPARMATQVTASAK